MTKARQRHRPHQHHWWRATIVVVALVLGVQLLEFKGVFASAEGIVADAFLRLSPTPADHPRVVTIAIDPHDYARYFLGRSPLDPEALAALVQTLAALGRMKVLGVNVLTESDAYARAPLARALTMDQSTPAPVPIVWTASARQVGAHRRVGFSSWLLGEHDVASVLPGRVLGASPDCPSGTWGISAFPLDHDHAIRRFPRQILVEGAHDTRICDTFARAIARQYCAHASCAALGHAEEIYLTSGAATSKDPDYTVGDLFECATPATAACGAWTPKDAAAIATLTNQIVLLGGTYEAEPRYDTPQGGHLPGLLVNAQAVRAEVHGPAITESWRPLTIVLDVIIGLLIVARVRPQTGLLKTLGGIGLLALAIGVGALLAFRYHGVLWVSWVAMLLTGLCWHLLVDRLEKSRSVTTTSRRRQRTWPAPD